MSSKIVEAVGGAGQPTCISPIKYGMERSATDESSDGRRIA